MLFVLGKYTIEQSRAPPLLLGASILLQETDNEQYVSKLETTKRLNGVSLHHMLTI